MKSAAEILAPALRRAMPRRSAFDWMVTAWPAIVGRRLAECTRPAGLADGVLRVSVSGSEWRAGLEGEEMAGEFRNRVNTGWGGGLVREVKFCDAKPRGAWVPKAANNSYTPFVRKRGVSTARCATGPGGTTKNGGEPGR